MTQLVTPVTRSVISSPDTQTATWFLGALSQVRLSREQTGGAFSVRENLARRGNASPVHVHDRDDETFLVLDGALRVVAGEQEHAAGPGTVAVLPRRLRHAYVVTSATARFLTLHTPGGFEQFAAEVGQPAQALTLPPNPPDRPTLPRWLRPPPGTASPSWPRRPALDQQLHLQSRWGSSMAQPVSSSSSRRSACSSDSPAWRRPPGGMCTLTGSRTP